MLSLIKGGIAKKLKNKAYRHRFFRGRGQDEIATQIREYRDLRQMKQTDLAQECAMKQSAVSRIEQASYSSWNLKTLWRVAEALDLRIRIIFEPMEAVIREYEGRETSVRGTERVVSGLSLEMATYTVTTGSARYYYEVLGVDRSIQQEVSTASMTIHDLNPDAIRETLRQFTNSPHASYLTWH